MGARSRAAGSVRQALRRRIRAANRGRRSSAGSRARSPGRPGRPDHRAAGTAERPPLAPSGAGPEARTRILTLEQRCRRDVTFVDRVTRGRPLGEQRGRQRDLEDVVLRQHRLDDRAESLAPVVDQRLAEVGPELLESSLAEVRDRGHLGHLEAGLDRPLDVREQPMLPRLDHRDRCAGAAGAARSTDPVDVRVWVRRHVVVDDVRNVRDVQPAGRDIRGHEHVQVAGAEPAHDSIALLLGQPAVERGRIVAAPAEALGEIVDLAPGSSEDQGGRRVLEVQDPDERGQLVRPADHVRDLPNERLAICRARAPNGS